MKTKTRIIINEERMLQVLTILDELWGGRAPIFKDVVLSQYRWPIPENTQKETANYLFYASLPMRGAVNSDDPFKLFYELYQKHPDLFDPDLVVKNWSPEKIEEAIREISKEKLLKKNGGDANIQGNCGSLGYRHEERTVFWYENSLILSKYWGSNILNVFNHGIVDFEDAFRRIDNKITEAGFIGMRRKIFSLLTIWLQEKQFVPRFPTPIPVDFHAMRIFWATKCVDIPKNAKPPSGVKEFYPSLVGYPAMRISEKITDTIAIWSQNFMVEHNLSYYNINPALWVIGRDFCRNQLQNRSAGGDKKKFISSKFFYPEKLRKNPNLWPKDYKDPCSYCPIEKFCTGTTTSNSYYRKGFLIRLERVAYPSQIMPGMEEYTPYRGSRRSVPKKK